MDSESTPLIRTILNELRIYSSFADINTYLHLVTSTSKKIACNPWNFNYEEISGLVTLEKYGGIFLGLEKQMKYPHIYADFAVKMKDRDIFINLQPTFIFNNKEIIRHIYATLEKIRKETLDFINLEEGEYLEREAELVLEHAEQLSLEEEIPLLELFDQISTRLAEINAERVKKNRQVVEFAGHYQKGKKLIEGVPPGRRTPVLERRLNM